MIGGQTIFPFIEVIIKAFNNKNNNKNLIFE